MRCVLFGYSQFRDISIGGGIVYVLEKKFVITLFRAQDIVKIICLKIFNMGSVGTQCILIDNKLQVWMVLTQFADLKLITFLPLSLRDISIAIVYWPEPV